jgi:hypothetical protein
LGCAGEGRSSAAATEAGTAPPGQARRGAGPRLQGAATSPPWAAAPRAGAGRARAQGWGSRHRGLVGRERLRREERRNKELGLKFMEEAHRGRRHSPEPKPNPSIAGDSVVQSTNRTHCDEALDETNAVVPSDSADDARIESNCRRSWNRLELRRAIPGARDRIWRKRFVFWNGLDEMKPDTYIYLGFG